MFSFLSVENRTGFPVICAKCGDGTVFADIPDKTAAMPKRICSGSVRVEILDNRMRPITLLWLPMSPGMRAHLCVYPDAAQFTPIARRAFF